MSKDQQIAQDLMKIAEDGRQGYAKGADELAGSDHPQWAGIFTQLSQQRAGFATEWHDVAEGHGEAVKAEGSAAAALHRGWMAVRDAVTGSGPDSVLRTALQGEDHAIEAYEKALTGDVSAETQAMARRQLAMIQSARQQLHTLLESAGH